MKSSIPTSDSSTKGQSTSNAVEHQAYEMQAAIFDALPAHIALIDGKGVILTVNDSWRRFALANRLQRRDFAVGQNYLQVCDTSRGECSEGAHASAEGIRQVLRGEVPEFTQEYPCHSPTERRWFRMMATSLRQGRFCGAAIMHVNVTERKLAELTLIAKEASLAAAQRIAHFGSWELDLVDAEHFDANPLRWSDEMFRIAGFEPGSVAVTRQLFYQLVPLEEHALIRQAVEKAISERRTYSIVHRVIRPDGEERLVHERAEITFDDGTGLPVRMVGTAHDITEQRRTEEALRRGEAEQRQLARQLEAERARLTEAQHVARMGSWETAIATMCVVWSEETHRIFETNPSEFHPTHEAFLERVHPDDRTAVNEAFIRSFDQTEPQTIDHRLLLKDGRIKHIKERWRIFKDESGRAIRALGTCQDVTEQKVAEEALRESEARFRGTFEQAAVGIAHVSVEGRFLRVNDKLCAILGYPREDLLGMAFVDLTMPEDRAGSLEARRALLAGEQSAFTTEKRYLHKDGRVVWVKLVTTLERTTAGNPQYFISVFTDVTTRKLAEFRLHRLNRLHRVLSKAGEVAIRSRARQDLFEKLCRIAVEDGLLRMALVVELDEVSRTVTQTASFGEGLEYLAELRITMEGLLSLGTIGTALRTGNPDFCNDIANDPRMAPWRDQAMRVGFRATASIPFNRGEVTVGALILFSSEAGYFEDDELRLMTTVAGNISFALDGLRKEEERQRAEAALRASESSMAVAQRIAHFGSWEMDLVDAEHYDANPLRWSDEMFRIAGFEPGSVPVTIESFFRLIPEEEQEGVRQAFAAAIRDRLPYSLVHRLIRPDGEVRFVSETAQITFDERSGRPLKMIGTAHDITEQRVANENLRQSQSLLRMSGRLGRIGAWSVEIPDYKVVWSEEVRVIHEVPPDFAPSVEEALEYYAPEFRQTIREAFAACVRDGTPFDLELQIISAQQRRTWVRSIGEAVRGAEGRIIRVQGALQDVTRQKAAEEAARLAGARLLETLESITDGFFTLDLDWRFTYLNTEAERLLCCHRNGVLGHTIWDTFPGLVGSMFEREYRRAVAEKTTATFEEYYLPFDQWFEVKAYPYPEGLTVYFRDVTERRRQREALRASEARFRTLIQSSWDVFHLVAKDGRILYESPAVTRVLGYQPEEMVGRPILEFVHPEDRGVVTAGSKVHWTTPGSQRSITIRVRHQNGSWRWIESFEVNLLDNPDVGGIAVNFRDITERRAAESDLRASEERFRLLAKSTNDAIWDWDLVTDRIWWNEGYETMSGRRRDEVDASSRSWTDFIHPDDLEWVTREVHAVIEGGRTEWSGEYRFVRKNGDLAYVLDRGRVLRDDAGKPVRMIGGMTDLTERRRIEEKIREQAALLDKAQDAILVRDLDYRVTYWNRSAERLYGWSAEEVLGRSVEELLYPDRTPFLAATQTTLEKGEWVGELTKKTKDGRQLTIVGRWSLVRDDAGQPKSILTIDTDITERKKLEAQFLRAQRMESIGTLAGGIAHDLNNALAPIIMSVDLLRMGTRDSRQLEIISTIEISARRGADMVAQVLSFARGVEGRKTVVQPRHLLRDLNKIASDTFPKDITVKVITDSDGWTVLGDSTQIHQVLLNLCVNARDAMPSGGTITLSSENVVLDEFYAALNPGVAAGPYVLLQVQDTGTGIPPEIVEKIFDPFFTTKEVGKGTGLGLSTTQAIVKSHGGFVTVYSEPGRGTSFKVYLPANVGDRAEALAVNERQMPRGHDELILIVDDEAFVREITRQTLEASGYRALLACDGADALALYAQHTKEIAVVMTDMMMPVMDGPATIRVLLKMNPHLKIIATSGITANDHVAKAVGAGVNDFLPKPYTAEALLKMLQKVLGKPEA